MQADSVLDVYLDDVRRVRALKAETVETSYYPALGALLNGVGGCSCATNGAINEQTTDFANGISSFNEVA